MKKRIGFIGLEVMGKPMAKNLMKAGYALCVNDIVKEPVKELVELGAKKGETAKEVGEKSDVVITMVPTSKEVKEVYLNEDGVLTGIKEESIVIDMSTIEPTVSQEIAATALKKNIEMLDAPVSGGQLGAIEGTLTIMVGGKEEIFKECKEIFEAMGKNIYYCGPIGSGEISKITNNLVAAICMQATCEGMVLGIKAGVQPKVLFEIMSKSSAQNWALSTYMPRKAFKGDFEPGFMVDLMYKDLGLANNLAAIHNVPILLGSAVRQIYEWARATGKGKKDFSAILSLLEEIVGVKARLEGA
ncbi:MAG: 3-hydroxyisobutyrate dehydrogenase [Deltaproteobacteria bacterium]|nr:3-hydroxyisobutyrate dehydrogenase [Deltaproteobacteria bacterium]